MRPKQFGRWCKSDNKWAVFKQHDKNWDPQTNNGNQEDTSTFSESKKQSLELALSLNHHSWHWQEWILLFSSHWLIFQRF